MIRTIATVAVSVALSVPAAWATAPLLSSTAPVAAVSTSQSALAASPATCAALPAASSPAATQNVAAAPSAAPTAAAAPASNVSGLVNLNTATPAELNALPGVGDKTVARIVALRPIASVNVVQRMPGMTAARWAGIASRVTV